MVKAKSTKKTNGQPVAGAHVQSWRDIRSALLVVSLLINAFVLVGWAVLRLTSQYDASLASTLLGR